MVSRTLCLPASALFAALTGCASVPADWGRGDVDHLVAERGHVRPSSDDARTFTNQALLTPLTASSAIQLALLNNPSIRRETARLGFAAAEVYDAGRLANPVFSATRLSPVVNADGLTAQFTLGIAFNFVNLLFLPTNERLAKAQFEVAKLSVASSAVDLAGEVEAAWYAAVGADQLAQMREAADRAQRASANLAKRYFDAGNLSPRELAIEQAAASQATLAAISARAKAVEARSALNRLMGLSADQDRWTLDARLAEPLDRDDTVADLQALALRSRLDIESLRQNARALADRYGFTRQTRLINGLEVGVVRERDYDGAINVGPTLSLELPLFNWGGGRVAAARAALDQVEADLDARVLDASNGVKLAAARIEAAKSLASLYKTALVPQREAIVNEAQKEQNYMLIGVFDVILAKQQEYDAYAGYIEAVRDYWIARADAARAVGRTLPSSSQIAQPTIDPTQLVAPPAPPAGHDHHSMQGMPGMEMGVMPGMSHGPIAPESAPASGHAGQSAPHADHSTPTAPRMDHRQHGEGHAGHSMADMPGMDHDDSSSGADGTAKKACAEATASSDAAVRKAITDQCTDPSVSAPHAGHAPSASPNSEPSHAH